jgi:hypothetical protein
MEFSLPHPDIYDCHGCTVTAETPNICIPHWMIRDMTSMLDSLGPRGVLLLLGVRTTVGSIDIVPPTRYGDWMH